MATAEEDLRRQIELYEKRRMTPLQFAPRIRSHPVMLVTAENKTRDAREITQSYDGELVQTLRFPFGDPKLVELMQKNLEYTRQMLSSLGPPTAEMNGRPGWSEVPVDFVQEFLDNFWVMEQTAIHPPTVRSYIHAQTQQGELTRWLLLVSTQKTPTLALGKENLGIDHVGDVGLINRSRLGKDPTSLGVITDPDDELFGLSEQDIADADEAFANGEFPTRGKGTARAEISARVCSSSTRSAATRSPEETLATASRSLAGAKRVAPWLASHCLPPPRPRRPRSPTSRGPRLDGDERRRAGATVARDSDP